jgi:hypothetical protein
MQTYCILIILLQITFRLEYFFSSCGALYCVFFDPVIEAHPSNRRLQKPSPLQLSFTLNVVYTNIVLRLLTC